MMLLKITTVFQKTFQFGLRDYHRRVRRNAGMIHANRQRMNYSVEEYEKIFRDIFRGAESRRLYLFGSGQFAEMFLSQFHNDYDIVGILDNINAYFLCISPQSS